MDIAKQVHKRLGNAASEALLVDAYMARIRSLAERNLDAEARALQGLVNRATRRRANVCGRSAASLKARSGEIEPCWNCWRTRPWPAEKRAAIETAIRGAAGDPERISRCAVLPPEHPLRVAAGAVAQALEAATTGPVAAEKLALPEVSRQSPLAPWKMLLRAIASLYGNEVELCAKYLAAVEPGAAAARLVPPMRAMLGKSRRSRRRRRRW